MSTDAKDINDQIVQWRPLADRAARQTFRRLPRAVRNAVGLDELEAAALVALWRLLEAWNGAGDVGGYLARLLPCRLADFLRGGGPLKRAGTRRYAARQLSQLGGADARRASDLTARQCRRLVAVADRDEASVLLSRLQPREAAACRLYYLDGLPMREVAERLGVCESAVSHRLTALAREMGGVNEESDAGPRSRRIHDGPGGPDVRGQPQDGPELDQGRAAAGLPPAAAVPA